LSLSTFLQRVSVTTGPLLTDTGHTRLGWVKSSLLGNNPKVGKGDKKGYHSFGTYIHEMFLLGKSKTKVKLTILEKRMAKGMLLSLKEDVVVQKLMQNVVCEKTDLTMLLGVLIQFTPDAVSNEVTGLDLKTTVCTDENEFIEKAFEYGYFRQGETYSQAKSLKAFYIIGISKIYPHRVFIISLANYKDYVSYSKEELKFLLYFYKNYGNFKKLEDQKSAKDIKRHRHQISKKVYLAYSQASAKKR